MKHPVLYQTYYELFVDAFLIFGSRSKFGGIERVSNTYQLFLRYETSLNFVYCWIKPNSFVIFQILQLVVTAVVFSVIKFLKGTLPNTTIFKHKQHTIS